MEIVKTGKRFFSVELEQNESYDRNVYLDEMGPGLAEVSYFEGAGNLEFSADEITWQTVGGVQNELFSNTLVYPQFVRPSGVGTTTIHFVLSK